MTARTPAPVGISTYARADHLSRCLESLSRCDAAEHTQVFIFSDAPRAGHEGAVADVRNVAHAARNLNFAQVTVVERQVNDRIANNRGGIRQLLETHGRLVWLEEDIEVAPAFLSFMNAALDRYERDQRVLSVCGYRPPVPAPDTFAADAFALPRFCAWGFGTWASRLKYFNHPIAQRELVLAMALPHRFLRLTRGGLDVLGMAQRDAAGEIDALDVKLMFQQYLHELWTVYPARYLAANRGLDGSGVHCAATDRFDVPLDTQQPPMAWAFPPGLPVDREMLRAHWAFRSGNGRARWQMLTRPWKRQLRRMFVSGRAASPGEKVGTG